MKKARRSTSNHKPVRSLPPECPQVPAPPEHPQVPDRVYTFPKEFFWGGSRAPAIEAGAGARAAASKADSPDLPSVPEQAPPWRPPVLSPCPLRPPERPLPVGCCMARDAPLGKGQQLLDLCPRVHFWYFLFIMSLFSPGCVLIMFQVFLVSSVYL